MTTTLPQDHGGADASPPDTAPPTGTVGPPPTRLPEDDDRAGASEPVPDRALGEAAARLHAWHALREDSGGDPRHDPDHVRGHGAWAVPVGDAGVGSVPWGAPSGEDELVDRLRARRSARHVAAAYTAAHGHPVDGHDAGGGARRWSLGLRAAVVASVAVLLVAVVVAVVATARPDDVITLAGAPSGASAGPSQPPAGRTAGADAGAGTAADPAGTGDLDGEGAPAAPEAVPAPAPGTVVVHVVGEVREPGLVTVPSGARVADAVAAAGGTTRRADAAALNLARAVVDGEQIRVPRPGEQVSSADGAPEGAGEDGTGGGSDASAGGAVNLNSAGAADLEVLPGIGPALAERIVTWRDENGPFTSVDELDEVSGIGPSVLGQVRDLVTL
ncbi:ComEA family DNA-binding protein [Isoptericola sp. NPDC019482]|uniref:ComEA family DNA-binding protein n=1 Tax=Isoptericola sp. NPDC019482 TaxID=3154688 RepID=UPI003470CF9D